MRASWALVLSVIVAAGCGSSSAPATTGGGGQSGTGGTSGNLDAALPPPVDGGSLGTTGNPNGSCKAGVPSNGKLADVSNSTVVGSGTPASCTFSALNTAVGNAGVITFNCGSDPVTITVTATMKLSISKDTVIDGGNKVTLDGGHAVQIFNYNSANFQATETRVTLQRLALVNGKTTPTMPFPTGPQAACSQGYFDGQGGALFMRDGNLTVIDCLFDGNQAAQLGPDTGGGAIYMEGSKHGAIIVGSTFTNNNGANAGAVGALYAELDIYNSLFQNNKAVGHDANNDDSSMCSIVNNSPQHEVGSGGNGGAIYGDGNDFNIMLCGDAVLNNAAGTNAFGGGVFFTSDNFGGTLTFIDTTLTGNTGKYWTVVQSGSVTNAGNGVATNAKSITITNSTLQGL
jgi:predicted outer membrane repeat protein